jgi:hypothetical protein
METFLKEISSWNKARSRLILKQAKFLQSISQKMLFPALSIQDVKKK